MLSTRRTKDDFSADSTSGYRSAFLLLHSEIAQQHIAYILAALALILPGLLLRPNALRIEFQISAPKITRAQHSKRRTAKKARILRKQNRSKTPNYNLEPIPTLMPVSRCPEIRDRTLPLTVP
ncbi:hypothetical protein ACRE_006140 [Hapsidospora chrysogenum ATCC 11550]|uniref:Uncharacterized protein n=1 Tax=Hapsidospora chrysogenum (strain ATCC 11550 / CBS 779.69 / DSM 880 / IAM 14645 / JCM 23072 / IMI 49137) TaxID=857340 RepID=A0A086TGB5_HAPC1|nr:hypothetical protein ACRE_006140 [Hapsidospora chrysogenum ATCC 11550]